MPSSNQSIEFRQKSFTTSGFISRSKQWLQLSKHMMHDGDLITQKKNDCICKQGLIVSIVLSRLIPVICSKSHLTQKFKMIDRWEKFSSIIPVCNRYKCYFRLLRLLWLQDRNKDRLLWYFFYWTKVQRIVLKIKTHKIEYKVLTEQKLSVLETVILGQRWVLKWVGICSPTIDCVFYCIN